MKRWLRQNAVLLAVALCAVAIALSAVAIRNESMAARAACTIQNRGLIAEQYLTTFLVDLNEISVLTPTPPRVEHHKPKRIQELDAAALAALHNYARVEAKQPKHRSCP